MTQDEVVEAVRYHLNKAADTLEAEIEGFLPHSHRRLKALAAVRQARVLANEAAEIHGVRGSFLAERAREVNADIEAEEERMNSLDPAPEAELEPELDLGPAEGKGGDDGSEG